jgi:glycosyltransferase involved in cell wall biosynthesis
MKKPIGYLTSFYARAGDTFIRREVEELRRRGWTVHTFSIRRADESEAVSEEVLREQRGTDYILEHGPLRLLAAFLRVSIRSPRRMVRAIRQASALRWPGVRSWAWHWIYLVEAAYLSEQLVARGVSLLHNHIAMNSATVAMLASTLSGVPFSMTVHGLELLSAEQWALGRKIEAAATTVCISSFGRAQCMMFAPPWTWQKLHVVHCGLDRLFLEETASPVPDVARLACIGRLSPEKGQLLLVDAVAALRDRGIGTEIVLVGDGPMRAEIDRRARDLGVESRIRCAGWQGSAEVRRWIEESRAVVLPSFSEGIPVVLMEAMALGRPVIATEVGGIPELARSGENGWLVPAGSVEDLAGALEAALLASVEELDRMGAQGRKRVLERHDLSTEVAKLARLIEGVIGDHEKAGRGPVR